MNLKTILIVDDNRDIIRMIAEDLRSGDQDINILNANNGLNGIRVAQKEMPDLIILDWDMPIMNGLEAIRRLKNDASTHDIPVIMATGQMTSSQDLQLALETGAVDYLRKPIDIVELRARISTTMRMKEQHEAIKDLLQKEIELKNRKLSTTSMLLVEKNGLLQEFARDIDRLLTAMKTEDADSVQKLVKNLKRRISNHLDVDSGWDTFKVHFEEVNPVFFARLKMLSGDLSNKDLKMCAYLKLGMDNKEIARLLNITPASVRTSLYRLKIKIGIDEEENLRDFIVGLN